MTPEAWQAISAIVASVGAVVSAIGVAIISRTKSEARQGREAAEQARDNTVPISNGFARTTSTQLATLVTASSRHDQTLEWVTTTLGRHLAAHSVGTLCPLGHGTGFAGPPPPGHEGEWPPPTGEADEDVLRHDH